MTTNYDPTDRDAGVAELEARVDELERELAARDAKLDEVEAQRTEYLGDARRVAAEFENFRKRTARERETMATRANERLTRELLPVLDDLERAHDAAKADGEATVADGVSLVEQGLRALLEKEGVTEIEADGVFDPHVHEALVVRPDKAAEGTIIEILQKGYQLGDVVLRPARVALASPPVPGQCSATAPGCDED